MSTNNNHVLPALLGPFASPPAVASRKTMQQLLNEIDQVKVNVEASIRTLEENDASRDRVVEGRRQIKFFIEDIVDLQKQMNIMTKESDQNWPIKTFDEAKQNALKTLSNLLNKLNQVDQRHETATYPDTQPFAASSVSTENGNTKGVDALISKLPLDHTNKTASHATAKQHTPSLSTSDAETTSDEDEAIATDKKQEPPRSSQLMKKTETSSEEEEENDNHQLSNKLPSKNLKDSNNSDSQSQTSIPPRINKKSPGIKPHSTPSSSPISRKTTASSTSNAFTRNKVPSSHQPTTIPITEQQSDDSEDNSLFDGGDDELKRLHDSSGEEEEEFVHTYEQSEEDQPPIVNVEELRAGKYLPGTQFHVTHNLKGVQTGDLTIHKGEILILVEQRPDDWWLFNNPQTQQQGVVPINHIQLQSKTSNQELRHRIIPVTSASTLVDVFKRNNSIPSGFIASDLAPLSQENQYKLSYTLTPSMTESNFSFIDLHWRHDTDRIHIQQVKYQKILTIKKCSKIPRIKREQIRVLNRCIRVCLYDGLEIISNIQTFRAWRSGKPNKRDLTEDWHFITNDKKKYIDQQSQLLIRSNECDPSKHVHLLIELSQFCQSKISQEKCEVGCGWIMISLDEDNQTSVISKTNNYNECLHGGHFHETNILLDSQYKNFHSDGLSGRIDRYKQARIRFSLESRERHIDVLYDNLPLTSMVVPINLVRILVFYRNELAEQLQQRYHSDNLSTTPIHSIFLSTFNQTLEQPDLICLLQRLYKRPKGLNVRQQRKEFIKMYELSIYPLLFYRLLPPYDFHDTSLIYQRRKLIREIISKQLKPEKKYQPDILAILLDPSLTDKWTPFTTDEICFSLQK